MAEFRKDPPIQREQIVSSHAGTISRVAPHLLEQTQAQHLENLVIRDFGVRRRRNGAFSIGGVVSDPASEPFNAPGGMHGYQDATFNEFLTSVWGSRLYMSSAGGTWTQIGSAVSLVSNMLHQFINGRDGGNLSLAGCSCEKPTDTSDGLNGRSQLLVYDIDSDVATQVSLAPRCIETFQERIFYGENDTVGWSLVGNLTSFSDGNQIQVEPGVGGEITAIIASRDATPNLWILKERAIIIFQPRWGNDGNILPDIVAGDQLNLVSSSLRILNQNTGCIATKSAIWVPGQEQSDVLFLSEDGVRALERAQDDFQTGAGFPISYEIPTWINRINFAFAHKATAAFFDQAYHLSVPMDGAKDNTHVLRFDVRTRAWTLYTLHARDLRSQVITDSRMYMQNVFATRDSSVTDAVDFSDASDPPHFQVYQAFRGNLDPSTNATEYVVPLIREDSRAFTLGEFTLSKRWNKVMHQFSSTDTARVLIKYRVDQGQFNTVTEVVIAGTLGSVVLGSTVLPWEGEDEQKRRFSFDLSDIPPSRELQTRLDSVTGSTEIGRLNVYITEVQGHHLTDDFGNDN